MGQFRKIIFSHIFRVHHQGQYAVVLSFHQGPRCLQSCVGTWARLGYAAFDAQLRKAYFVTTLYTIHLHTLYAGDHVSLHPVLMIWVRMIQNNLPTKLPNYGKQHFHNKQFFSLWEVQLSLAGSSPSSKVLESLRWWQIEALDKYAPSSWFHSLSITSRVGMYCSRYCWFPSASPAA